MYSMDQHQIIILQNKFYIGYNTLLNIFVIHHFYIVWKSKPYYLGVSYVKSNFIGFKFEAKQT